MGRREEAPLAIVSGIYEAALEPGLWGAVLSDVQSWMKADSSILYVQNLKTMDASFEVLQNLDPEHMRTYYRHYITVDPIFARRRTQPVGSMLPSHAIIADGDLERSEYYQDFMRGLGRFYTVGGPMAKDADGFALFSLQRNRAHGPFSETEQTALGRIVPHLRRAFQIGVRLAGREVERQALLALLERLPTGVLLLDERGKVVFVNLRAQSILAGGDSLVMAPQGLSTAAPELQPVLERLIREAVQTGAGNGALDGGALLVPTGMESEPYHVLVTPLRTERARVAIGPTRICAAVFVQLRDAAPKVEPDLLRDLFGLTPAEARVAAALVQGQRPEEIAAAASASRFTVRAQLSSIYEKLGVHRQAELVQRILTSPAGLVGPNGQRPADNGDERR